MLSIFILHSNLIIHLFSHLSSTMIDPSISVLSAKHARIVLRQTSRRSSLPMIQRHARQTLGQQSLIMLSGGSDWKRQRGLVQYALTADAIAEHKSIIIEVANAMVTVLTNLCKKESDGRIEVDVVHIAQCFTLETFGKVALGHDFHCFSDVGATRSREAEAFAFLVNDIPKRCSQRAVLNPLLQMYSLPTAHNRRYKVEREIVENLLHSVIQQSKDSFASSTRDSLKSSNVNGGSSKKNRENLLTHIIRKSESDSADALVDMMKTILFAGYETTAITIVYVLYNLTKYPEFQEQCCEEAKRIVQTDDDFTIRDLRFTRAVIMESMRLNPTVLATSRTLTKTTNLGGYTIPAGFRITIPLIKVLVDERNFERAKEFIPTRWVKWSEEKNEWVERDHRQESTNNCEEVAAADPANFLAFSDGARDCVGKRLAMNEATVALAFLMKHFRVAYDERKPVEKKRRLTSWFPHKLQIKFLLRDDVE
ncbi:hypothetical protein ACHAXM_011875 [Skeletonema potamos]|jgi:cytochrome P450